jgi:hypothetical protein
MNDYKHCQGSFFLMGWGFCTDSRYAAFVQPADLHFVRKIFAESRSLNANLLNA